MSGDYDNYTLLVIVTAFVLGYSIVSFLIKKLKDLKDRPNLSDTIWDEHMKAEERLRSGRMGNREDAGAVGGSPHEERRYESVLGLTPGATPEEIKRRYRSLVAQYHPDKAAHLGPKLREVAEAEMKAINEAYDYFKSKYGLS